MVRPNACRTLLAAGCLAALAATAAAQPAPSPAAPGAPGFVTLAPDAQSAQEVRERLAGVLRQYPPAVREVLRLDPSLLTREGYLDPYPGLAAFIAQHPDIVRNPTFYLGSPGRNDDEPQDSRYWAMRSVVDTVSYVTALSGFVAAFVLIGWLARLLVDHRRWLRVTRLQTETHAKLLDRLTSNAELLAYIQSPAGQGFLQSAPVAADAGPRAVAAPVNRILWSVQAGVVLAVVGLGLWLVRGSIFEELSSALNVLAVLVMALGIGFALSAVAAYLISLRFGLFEPPRP